MDTIRNLVLAREREEENLRDALMTFCEQGDVKELGRLGDRHLYNMSQIAEASHSAIGHIDEMIQEEREALSVCCDALGAVYTPSEKEIEYDLRRALTSDPQEEALRSELISGLMN